MDRPRLDDPDNPEWTEEDFARARPASEVLPRWLAKALVRPKPETHENADAPRP